MPAPAIVIGCCASALGSPRGDLPNTNSTTFSTMMPTASVLITHAMEPRFTNGRTASRSNPSPNPPSMTTAAIAASSVGQPRSTTSINVITAPSITAEPWAKLSVLLVVKVMLYPSATRL